MCIAYSRTNVQSLTLRSKGFIFLRAKVHTSAHNAFLNYRDVYFNTLHRLCLSYHLKRSCSQYTCDSSLSVKRYKIA